LISADNPETDEITYTYYDDGSLETITDARTIETSFTYDALGRVTAKNFDESTPDVTYSYYTSGAPKIGRLQSVASSAATETFNAYDTLGRVTSHTQTITGNSNSYTLAYTYRLDDSIATMTYPSGRVVSNTVDDAGRTELVSDGTTDLLTTEGGDYDAQGRLTALELGNGLFESRHNRPAGTATTQ
jgi:YD repeat-containing protein